MYADLNSVVAPDRLIEQTWLDTLARMLPGVEQAQLFEADAGSVIACWPADAAGNSAMQSAAELIVHSPTRLARALESEAGAADLPQSHLFAQAIKVKNQVHGILTVVVRIAPAQQAQLFQLLSWGEQWLQLMLGVSRQSALADSKVFIDIGRLPALALAPLPFSEAFATALLEARRLLRAESISLLRIEGATATVVAISGQARFDRRLNDVRALEGAVESLLPSSKPGESVHGERQSLFRCSGNADEEFALLIDWPATGREANESEVCRCGDLLGQLATLHRRRSHPLYRLLDFLLPEGRVNVRVWFNSHRFTALVLLVAIILLSAVIPVQHRVSGEARLEGKIQRVIVAPYDAFIRNASVRAGDTVTEGDVLAELDDRDLQLERSRLLGQRGEYDKQYRQALALLKQQDARIFEAQIAQVDASLALVDKQLQRARLLAPISGIVVAGDLSQSLGGPVSRGDTLFELAPLDNYRIVLQLDERDVIHVSEGQQGKLILNSLPSQPIPFTVESVSTLFDPENTEVEFQVHAYIAGDNPLMRPGMEGIAKLDVGRRSALWVAFHRPLDWLRLSLWSLQP